MLCNGLYKYILRSSVLQIGMFQPNVCHCLRLPAVNVSLCLRLPAVRDVIVTKGLFILWRYDRKLLIVAGKFLTNDKHSCGWRARLRSSSRSLVLTIEFRFPLRQTIIIFHRLNYVNAFPSFHLSIFSWTSSTPSLHTCINNIWRHSLSTTSMMSVACHKLFLKE